MAVLPIKHEPRCKICVSEHRAAIDVLLELRSNRGEDDAGERVTLDYVLARMGEWGIVNPTEDNVKNHWRKHCQVVNSEIVEQAQAAAVVKVQQLLEEGVGEVDVNRDLDVLWAIGMAEMEERIARGERSGITPDMLMKIAAEKTRRQHSESQDQLLKALAGGIAGALGGGRRMIGEQSEPSEDVVEGEIEEIAA